MDKVRGPQTRAANMSSCMRVEERWRVLYGSDMETFLNGCSLVSSKKLRVVLVICDGLLKLSPVSMLFALLPPQFCDLFGSREL